MLHEAVLLHRFFLVTMAQRVWLLLEVSMQLSEAGISAETGTGRPRPRLLQKLIRGGLS
jgi:hypothetical protein